MIKHLAVRAPVAGALFAVCGLAMAQSFSGAVYTSLGDGSSVNANLYDAKPDVYLNGGPQNANAAGLPVGTYYFQVTSPDGVLLSEDDAVCRQVEVLPSVVSGKGVISGASLESPADCRHADGVLNPDNGSIPVQLIPYADTPNNGGTYKVWLIQKGAASIDAENPRALIFANSASKTDSFKVALDDPDNPDDPRFSISGMKFYDTNGNGLFEPEADVLPPEAGVGGFIVQLYSPDGLVLEETTTSFFDGSYSFMNLVPGEYGVCEIIPTGDNAITWVATLPINIDPLSIGPDSVNNDFGNMCFINLEAKTLGFWSNPNGMAILAENDPAWRTTLNGLNLRTANGSNFDVAGGPFGTRKGNKVSGAYGGFRDWLLGGNATNMAYMLSVQTAAMTLNVNYGDPGVPGSAKVLAGDPPEACAVLGLDKNGIVSVNDLLATANQLLAGPGNLVVTSDSDLRSCMGFVKDVIDAANNNENFVGADCTVTYSGEEESCARSFGDGLVLQ